MPNYKTYWFIKKLTEISGKSAFEEAIKEWGFSHFGAFAAMEHCQLCHTPISNFVAIKCRSSSQYLLIGHDCYRKLVAYLGGRLDSKNLPLLKDAVRAIRKYSKSAINENFLKWFETRTDLPDDIRDIFEFIRQSGRSDKFGHAPSVEAAEKIISYYNNNRRFKVRELLSPSEKGLWDSYPDKNEVGESITISEIVGVKERLAKYNEKLREEWRLKNEKRQRALAKIVEYARTRTPLTLEEPKLFHDYGKFSEATKRYVIEPRLELRFKVDGVDFSIELPRRVFKSKLELDKWTSDVTSVFKDTLPLAIIPEVIGGYYLKLGEVDQNLWLVRVKARLNNENKKDC